MEKKIVEIQAHGDRNHLKSITFMRTIVHFTLLDIIFTLVDQELPTLPEHLSSPPIFSGVRVTRSLVLCVMFRRLLFVLLPFFIWSLCCL